MQDPIEVRLADLLRDWSVETAKMAALAEKLQTILVLACAQASSDHAFYRDAQACDLLTQTLDSMSRFMASVAASAPECIIDITQATNELPLADLVAAFSNGSGKPFEQCVGEVELFAND